MAKKDLYYNNNESTKQIITEIELDNHNTSDDAHKEKFDKYTLHTPTGIWDAVYQLGPNYKFTDQSTKGFAKLGLFASAYDAKDVFEYQPSQFGTLLNLPTTIKDSNFITVTQLWFDQSGDLFVRTGTVNNPINKIQFTKVTLMTDVFNKYGSEFPATNLVPGMLFYRTDENKLYAYVPSESGSSWKLVFDLNKNSNIADGLSHAWYKLDNSTNDTSIPKLAESENMNTYITPGVYSCISGQVASTLINKPSEANSNFRLVVEENIPGYGVQKVYTNNPCKVFIRGYTTTGNKTTFTDWKTLVNSADTILHAETATRDSAGNVINDTYVKKIGDTMTGGITFSVSATGNNYVGPGEGDVSDAVVANQSNLAINGWQTVGIRKSESDPYTISMNTRTGDIHTKGKIIGDSTATFTGAVTAPTFNGHATEASKVSITNVSQDTVLLQSTQTNGDGCRIVIGRPNDCNMYFQLNDSDTNAATPASFVLEQRYNNYGSVQSKAVLLDASHNTSFPGVLTAARVVNAQYNDYAEFFERGEETEAGDIIALDLSSDEERYVKATPKNNVIVGIHSDEYAHIIGGEKGKTLEENLKNFIPVALAGRVHVKVSGVVYKGDRIVISDGMPGIGVSLDNNSISDRQVIGIALENKYNLGTGKIRILLR
jgi:hypothetical protein